MTNFHDLVKQSGKIKIFILKLASYIQFSIRRYAEMAIQNEIFSSDHCRLDYVHFASKLRDVNTNGEIVAPKFLAESFVKNTRKSTRDIAKAEPALTKAHELEERVDNGNDCK